ncbi:periplasmic heavy metal sensor [Pseudoponticoccus marisrubri]|uniref:Uncharacterized protein n=1 Tax=Pseudoponticoccus marisrubri TaxID=1685382 RepID=A0A0W7WNP3_9RHOB|nr:periplasmic heavy metal sensor [Pseudoponticoccus marisrubri]KUF12170.1 hypothetical protein AVJ23_00070 [Pseudoponticoccus marisrubri]
MAELPRRGAPKPWLRIVLFASLALNLAVAGLVAGMLLSGGPRPPDGRHKPGDAIFPYTRAFDEAQGRALRDNLRQAFREDWDGVRRDLLDDYRAALEVLRAEPFDAQAMQALVEAQVARAEARRLRGQEVFLAMLEGMSPEDRRAYADRLEDHLARLDARRRDKRPRD